MSDSENPASASPISERELVRRQLAAMTPDERIAKVREVREQVAPLLDSLDAAKVTDAAAFIAWTESIQAVFDDFENHAYEEYVRLHAEIPPSLPPRDWSGPASLAYEVAQRIGVKNPPKPPTGFVMRASADVYLARLRDCVTQARPKARKSRTKLRDHAKSLVTTVARLGDALSAMKNKEIAEAADIPPASLSTVMNNAKDYGAEVVEAVERIQWHRRPDAAGLARQGRDSRAPGLARARRAEVEGAEP